MQGRRQNTETSESGDTDGKKTCSGIKLHLVDRKKANVEGFAFTFITKLVDDVKIH
jgi:hypothetical protein